MGTDIHGIFQKKVGDKWEDVESLYKQDRHYILFAWLGDVRNGFGFAGRYTHDIIQPLSSERGLPDDFEMIDEDHPIKLMDFIDPIRREYSETDEFNGLLWMGDHSHSYLTGKEILNTEFPEIRIYDKPLNMREPVKYFIDEVQRLTDLHGEIRFVFGFDS